MCPGINGRPDPDGLNVREFVDAEGGELAAVTAMLDTTKREPWVRRSHAIDEDGTRLNAARQLFRTLRIAGPEISSQAVLGVVRDPDRLISIRRPRDRRHGTERLFLERRHVGTNIGQYGRLVEVAFSLDAVATDGGGYVVGANRPDAHLRGVVPGRDFDFERGDVRTVVMGDTVGGHPVRIEPAIEVGNIFKLGTRYSDVLGATYLDHAGASQTIWMGCYGIGPARIAAAAIEQFADDRGISWPRNTSPFDVHLVTLGKEGSDERSLSDGLYEELQALGLDTLYDERDAGPGEKFADAELLGCPLRVTIGRRTLQNGEIEVQVRSGQETRALPLEGAAPAIAELWRDLP